MSEAPPPASVPEVMPNSGWLKHWDDGIAPGARWDALRTEPAFQRAIDTGSFAHLLAHAVSEDRAPRAMVPGCGRGYSVISLARAGFETLGLDLADKALDEVRTLAAQVDDAEAQARVLLQAGDFFALTPDTVGGQKDLVYDCTFLCAIPPTMRLQWATQMATLIRPGGTLVLTVFPVKPDSPQTLDDPTGTGPPFGLSSALVRALLAPVGFTMASSDMVSDEELARPNSSLSAGAKEIIEVWTRDV